MLRKSNYKAPKNKSSKSIWNSLMTIGLIVFIIIISIQIFGVFRRKYEIELEKKALLNQVSRIKQDTISLEQVREYISSSAYQEREAKQKLDLKKEGEQVVLITPGSVTANLNDEELISILRYPKSEDLIPAQTNPQKWWAFFFDKDRL